MIDLTDRPLFARQMFEAWNPVLGLSEGEHARAIETGFQALETYERDLRRMGRDVLDLLERERRIGIVVLGRVYHHDPGLNHGILEELQKLGYPILSHASLPLDADVLDRLFGEEVRAGLTAHPLDITDVWKNAFSASTNHKVWAAKFVARHPNLVALELSSFKCGHDAPIYTVIEQIIQRSGTPYFAFKDIDENRPAGSIKIRVETIHYFLTRYREQFLHHTSGARHRARRLAGGTGARRHENGLMAAGGVFRLAADVVVILHAAFACFIIAGGALVWRWPRAAWAHVPAVIWGVAVELGGWVCPLTPLENALRLRGGGDAYQGAFVDHYIIPLLYPDRLTPVRQALLGCVALGINAAVYGVLLSRRHRAQRGR